MNNLTTRKIVLGMLMTLVLAFSVQGTADALKFGTSRTGDLQTALPNQQGGFKIRFSVTLGSNSTKIYDADDNLVSDDGSTRIDSSGYNVFEASNEKEYRISAAANALSATYVKETDGTYIPTSGTLYVDSSKNVVDDSGAAVYIQSGDTAPFRYTRAKADPDAKVPDNDRYHYNEEAVTITVADAYITKVGRYEFTDPSKTTHTLREKGKDDTKDKLSGSVEVTFNAPAAAVVQITITDTTPTDDAPATGIADPITFTVYVVKQQSEVQNQATTFASGKDGVEYGYDTEDPQIDNYFEFAPDDAPVNYSVEGSGRVYISVSSNRRTSSTNNLWTSSEAPVYLDVNRGTSKVTAWISGNPGKTAVYIFSGQDPSKYPHIEITQSSNNQIGATEARLEDYLEVKVTDGNRRAVSGVAVGFVTVAANSEGSEQMFIPVPGTIVYRSGTDLTQEITDFDATPLVDNADDTTTATSNRPGAGEAIFVQTDRNGVAQVYYQLGDGIGDHQVMASLRGDPFSLSETFDATAVLGSRSASLVIVSGNNQRSDADTP